MIQVFNGEIIQHNLPNTGKLKDGTSVSGYHLLDEETLRGEGWLPLEDIKPEYNEETQYLINDGYEILEDKVIVKYSIVDIITKPNEIDMLKAQNKALVDRQEFLEDVITEMAMKVYD